VGEGRKSNARRAILARREARLQLCRDLAAMVTRPVGAMGLDTTNDIKIYPCYRDGAKRKARKTGEETGEKGIPACPIARRKETTTLHPKKTSEDVNSSQAAAIRLREER